MPIFSSQLVKVEEMSPEKGVKTIANHLRKLQEELEYRLMHLDSSNIDEINAKDTTILLEDEDGNFSELIRTTTELTSKIGDAEGNLSILQQKADSITQQVGDADGNVGILEVRANAITQKVTDEAGNIGKLETRADAITQTVSTADGSIGKLETRADSITQQVSTVDGNIGKLETRADAITQTVSDASGNIGKLETRADEITAQVADADGNLATLQTKANGITQQVSDASGNLTTLKTKADGITAQVADASGNLTTLQTKADGITQQVSNADGKLTTLKTRADGITAQVSTADGNIGQLETRAKAVIALVGDGKGNMGTLETRADAIAAQVSTAEGNIGQLQLTAQDFTTRISSLEDGTASIWQQTDNKISSAISESKAYAFDTSLDVLNYVEEKYSTTEQTASAIEAAVVDVTAGQSTMLRLDATGVYIVDGNGNQTTINGSQLKADSIKASKLHLGGEMTVYKTKSGDTIGGYIGYCSGWESTDGIGVMHSASTGQVICTDEAVRISHGNNAQVICMDDYLELRGVTAIRFALPSGYLDSGDDSVPEDFDNYARLDDECFRPYNARSIMLGNASNAWDVLYAGSCSCCDSDRNKKNSIEALPDKYLAMFDDLVPVRFKLNKGRSGRYHIGYIAQEVKTAMDAAGIDSTEFGGWIEDTDEDGTAIYMLRYEEFGAIYAAKIKQLEARLARVEEAIA